MATVRDGVYTVLRAAGFNIRWLMRAIACLGCAVAFLRLH